MASAVSVVASKHNLSASGPGTFKAATEPEICIFCHTPHGGSKAAPLWNRNSSGQTYLPYTSSTAKASPGQPTGSSKLCLSCHDGTVALGMVLSRGTAITMRAGATQLSSGASLLGTDLRDDHPVSFTYDAALVSANGQLKSPATLPSAVKLDANGQVQCTSCHDAHNNQFGKFLVLNNTGAALCSSCHSMTSWNSTSHATALKTWNGVGTNPWPHTTGTTVQSNACENCHRPHSAGNKARLENFAGEESNCYSCHNGNVAAKNIQAEFSKASVHPIATTTGVHDPVEDPVNSTRHVECEDCHNPHASNATTAAAPAASGDLAGVVGINSAGLRVSPVVNQYELCYRCHGDSTNRGPARIARVSVQTNARLEFQNSNASFHPVAAVGKSLNVPSLIAPLTVNSRIYCTDCHSNNTGPGAGGTGPAGPHGSTFTPLLERRMDTADRVTESATIYALCYKCHNRTVILSGTGFRYHETHLTSSGRTSCTTCHDSHGVAGSTHLINFNTAYVTKSTRLNSGPTYKDNGNGRGSCTLTCHGTDHDNWTY
jgi:predicted CXXCH cytochrome family protein